MKEGDLVRLNSGVGPVMEIVSADDEKVTCTWLGLHRQRITREFPKDCVRPVNTSAVTP